MKVFYKSAALLVRNIKPLGQGNEKTVKDMKVLYPGREVNQKVQAYYIEKIRKVLLVIFVGSILSLGVYLYQQQGSRVTQEGIIRKNSLEEGSFLIDLQAESERTEGVLVVVEPRSLTEAEAQVLAEEAFHKLRTVMLNQNTGVEQVTSPLNLISQLEHYPFQISWESNRPNIVKPNGVIANQQVPPEGEPVTVRACLSYQDAYQSFRYVKEIELQVYPPEQSDREQWKETLLQAIEGSKEESAYQETLQLPEQVQGIAVRWSEKPKKDSGYLWIMVLLLAVVVYLGQDSDLHQKVIKRNRQMERDYPELVSKLVLYLGAGITVKNAWKRMIQDYTDRGSNTNSNILYEEMLVSWRELENGVSEGEVYYRFGKRLGGNRYRKLSGLLCNHLQKGNKNLLQVLREEADFALEERKNTARVLGEEMGTKMLLPMMIMLLIVMVMIMVPAYAMF